MPSWLIRILPVVVPAVALSVVGVLVGALVKWAFGIPEDVALAAGKWIAIGSLVLTFVIYLFKTFRKKPKG